MTLAWAVTPDDDGDRRNHLDDSLAAFVEEEYPRLREFLRRACFDANLAEDALQEAMIVTMEKWPVVSTYDQPLYWVRKTAWYILQNLQRDLRKKTHVPLETAAPDLVELTTAHEAERLLEHLAAQLPDGHRAVLALMREGDSVELIAEQLGLAVTTVRTYQGQIRRKLRKLLEGDGGVA